MKLRYIAITLFLTFPQISSARKKNLSAKAASHESQTPSPRSLRKLKQKEAQYNKQITRCAKRIQRLKSENQLLAGSLTNMQQQDQSHQTDSTNALV